MDGPSIMARFLAEVRSIGDSGFVGQFHSRTPLYSKVECWAILLDLLSESALLRSHAANGRVICGLDFAMGDYKLQRTKKLDLVIATPGTPSPKKSRKAPSFKEMGAKFGLSLTDGELDRLNAVPDMEGGPVGSVRLALEAKACMTEHIKALPRLYDELNSSQLTVHGSADQAIAAGLVLVNIAETFMSSDKNPLGLNEPTRRINKHRQPLVTERTVAKVKQLPGAAGPEKRASTPWGLWSSAAQTTAAPSTF